ncbi:MAG: lasso peptide biosynthesis B2 protein [Candidatus Poribacteria bacterium]|nr:lasso peptide biosynthesis B2 protein [Candidatus Poribacteria bacterium]
MKIIEAYIRFIVLFFVLKFRGIRYYAKYFDTPSFCSISDSDKEILEKIKRAVDLAVRFMVFNSDCVYQSLAFAMMLRRRAIPAVVCMGVSSFPFRAHAWVEVNNEVVSGDDSIVSGLYPLKKGRVHG